MYIQWKDYCKPKYITESNIFVTKYFSLFACYSNFGLGEVAKCWVVGSTLGLWSCAFLQWFLAFQDGKLPWFQPVLNTPKQTTPPSLNNVHREHHLPKTQKN
jgi:hypothetical protein